MSDEAWKAGEVAKSSGGLKRPRPIPAEDYGKLPSVTKVATEVLQDLFANFGAYLLCGLGTWVVLFPVVLGGVVLTYASLLVPLLVWEDEQLAWMLFIPTFMVFVLTMVVVSAPLQAGVARAALAWQRDGEPMGFGSAFRYATADLWAVIGLELLIALMALVGAVFCYVPALIVALLTSLAFPALVVHRLGATGSLSASIEHVRKHIGWHAGFWGLGLGMLIICQNIPVIGAFLSLPLFYNYQIRVYRQVFGDGDEPLADVA